MGRRGRLGFGGAARGGGGGGGGAWEACAGAASAAAFLGLRGAVRCFAAFGLWNGSTATFAPPLLCKAPASRAARKSAKLPMLSEAGLELHFEGNSQLS